MSCYCFHVNHLAKKKKEKKKKKKGKEKEKKLKKQRGRILICIVTYLAFTLEWSYRGRKALAV